MRRLACDPQKIKGMSEKLIVSHHEGNYGGGVKRLNAIVEQLGMPDFSNAPVFCRKWAHRVSAAVAGLGVRQMN